MIISRYISKEIIVNICWVSLVLFGLVLFSRFNNFLGQAEAGKISAENILIAMALFTPELINIVFPLSISLAVGFVLTPLFKNHQTVFESGNLTNLKIVWSQKWVFTGIFATSLFISAFLSPYFTTQGDNLLDRDNSFASKIATPNGLVALQPSTLNAFGSKNEEGYEELIFVDSQSLNRFIYGKTGSIVGDLENPNLNLKDGFLYDKDRNIISKFAEASIPIDGYKDVPYVSTLKLLRSTNLADLKELFTRLSLPFFCIVSLFFSIVFSSYSSFFGRERTYFFLAVANIFYLLVTLSAFDTKPISSSYLVFNFFWMHDLFLLIAILMLFKPIKRAFGYEGI